MAADKMQIKKKFLGITFAFFALLAFSGCGTMMILLGDNFRYSISGKAKGASYADDKGIPGVEVSIKCPGIENSIYQNRKCVTGGDGQYETSGYWKLNGCTINFMHEGYNPLTFEIDKSHLVRSQGLSLDYEVNAVLTPKGKSSDKLNAR